LAIGLKSWDFFVAIGYIVVDYMLLGKGMTMTRKQREARELEIVDKASDPLTKRTSLRKVTYAGLALLGAMVITAWVVFIKYLM
jgi:hypothetical protein